MKVWIRQFSIIMIASLMLFSTTGLAIYDHICGCPVPSAVLSQNSHAGHSCCEAQTPNDQILGCTDGDHDRCTSENHKGCHNEVTYLKAPIISEVPVQEQTVSGVSFKIPDFQMPDTGSPDEPMVSSPLIRSYVLPPRAGSSLVILLHSIKIPSPEDYS